MKRLILASVLAASTLWLTAPAKASVAPPLPPARTSFQSGSLHVNVYGAPNKQALVFIPGLTCGPWEWAGEIERFSPDYTIYALTLPGFDGQPAIAAPLFQTVSADFWTLLQTHHIDRPIIIGHSLGGTLGFMLAEQHPDRLRALVAVDGMPIFPGMENMTPLQRNAAAQRFASSLASIRTAGQFEDVERRYVLPMMVRSQRDVDAMAPLVAKSDPQAAAQWAAADVSMDLRPELRRITIPVEEIVPGSSLRPYYRSLLTGAPTLAVEAVDNSKHFIMYDQPKALDALLAQTLASQAGPT